MLQQLMAPHEDKWGILPLQNCILGIAKYIDDFCKEHGIEYYLMGGSALGAVRHKGFIPWDDDLDIFMTPDNYEKFRAAFQKEGNKRDYYLQERGAKNGMLTYADLRYNFSEIIEAAGEDMDIHHGVFVDIFLLHECPDAKLPRIWQYLWARYIVVKGLANRKNYNGAFARRLFVMLISMFPKRFLLGTALRQIYRFRNKKSKYYCHFLGRAGMRNGVYDRSDFGTPRYMQFETIELAVPSHVESYLSMRWGDYMKIPSTDQIAHFQHSTRWSVDLPNSIVNEKEFVDEKYYF